VGVQRGPVAATRFLLAVRSCATAQDAIIQSASDISGREGESEGRGRND